MTSWLSGRALGHMTGQVIVHGRSNDGSGRDKTSIVARCAERKITARCAPDYPDRVHIELRPEALATNFRGERSRAHKWA
jgi:hypothetical protein